MRLGTFKAAGACCRPAGPLSVAGLDKGLGFLCNPWSHSWQRLESHHGNALNLILSIRHSLKHQSHFIFYINEQGRFLTLCLVMEDKPSRPTWGSRIRSVLSRSCLVSGSDRVSVDACMYVLISISSLIHSLFSWFIALTLIAHPIRQPKPRWMQYSAHRNFLFSFSSLVTESTMLSPWRRHASCSPPSGVRTPQRSSTVSSRPKHPASTRR